jgi:hypothetical protein
MKRLERAGPPAHAPKEPERREHSWGARGVRLERNIDAQGVWAHLGVGLDMPCGGVSLARQALDELVKPVMHPTPF